MPLRRHREPDLGQRIAALQHAQASHKRGKRIIGGIPLVLPGLGVKQSKQQSKSNFSLRSKSRQSPRQQRLRTPEPNDENQSEEWARFSEATFTSGGDENKNDNSKKVSQVDGIVSRKMLSTSATPLSPCNRNLGEFGRGRGTTTGHTNLSYNTHFDSSRSVNGKINNFFSKVSRVESEIESIIDMANNSCNEERRKPSEKESENGESYESVNETWNPWYDDQVFTTGTFDSDNGKEVLVRNDPPETSRIGDAPKAQSSASLSSVLGSANDDRDLTDDPPEMNLNAYYQHRSARGRLGIVERIDVFSPESISNRNLDELCEPVQRNRPRHDPDNKFNTRHTCITPRTTNSAKETDSISRDACSSLTRSSGGRWNSVHHQSTSNADPTNRTAVMTFHRLQDVPEGKIRCLETLQSPTIQKAKSQVVEIRTTGDIEFELYDPKIHGPIRQSHSDGVRKHHTNLQNTAVREKIDTKCLDLIKKQASLVQQPTQREVNASQFNSEADEIDKLLAILDPSSVATRSETRKQEPLASANMNVSHIDIATSSRHRESTTDTQVEFNDSVRLNGKPLPPRNVDEPRNHIDKTSNMNLILPIGETELPYKCVEQKMFVSDNHDAHHHLDTVFVDNGKQRNENNQLNSYSLTESSESLFPTFMTSKKSQATAGSPAAFSLPDDKDVQSPLTMAEKRKMKTPNSDSKVLAQGNRYLHERNTKFLEKRAYASDSIRKYWQDYSNVRSRGSFDSLSEAVYSGVNSSMNQIVLERNETTASEKKTFEDGERCREYSSRDSTGLVRDKVSEILDIRKEMKEGQKEEKVEAKTNHQNQHVEPIRSHVTGHVQNAEHSDKNCNSESLLSTWVHPSITSPHTRYPLQTTWEDDLASIQLSLKESEALYDLKNRARFISEKYDLRNSSSQKILDPPQTNDRSISRLDLNEQRKRSHVVAHHTRNHMPQRSMDAPQIGNSSELSTRGNNDLSRPRTSEDASSSTQKGFEGANKLKSELDLTLPRRLEPPQNIEPMQSRSTGASKEQERESSISQMSFEVAKTLQDLRNRTKLLSTTHESATHSTNENEETQLSDALFSLNEPVTLKELRNRVQAISSRYSTLTARAVEEYAEKLKHQQKPRSSDYKYETQSLLSSGSLDSDVSVRSRFENEDYTSTGLVYDNMSYLTDENVVPVRKTHHESSKKRSKRPYSQQHEFTGYSRRGRNKGSFDSLNFMTRASQFEVTQIMHERPSASQFDVTQIMHERPSASQVEVTQIMHERPSNNLTRRYDRRDDGTGTNILPPFYERDTTDQSTFDEPSTHAQTPILSNVKTNSGDANSEYSDEDEHSTADKETDVNPGCSFVCAGVDVCALLGGRWCGSCVNN